MAPCAAISGPRTAAAPARHPLREPHRPGNRADQAPRDDRESLEWVAYLYNIAELVGLTPARQVADGLNLPHSTATKWIKRAKDIGLIPEEGKQMASITKRPDGQWRARYRDATGKEHARHFTRKLDGQRWLDEMISRVVTGTYVDKKTARTTVGEWCDTWLAGFATRRPGTLRQARVHLNQIRAEFASMQLAAVRPSQLKACTRGCARKGTRLATSTRCTAAWHRS